MISERPLTSSLEYVDEIEWDEIDYEFNSICVWKEKRGRYYIAADSGCCCSVPYEDYTYVDQLTGPLNKKELRAHFDRILRNKAHGISSDEAAKRIQELIDRLI